MALSITDLTLAPVRNKHDLKTNRTNWRCIVSSVTLTEAVSYGHWSTHAFRDTPKAQYMFKFLSAHGILQFTMLIALRCTLHRRSNRDIRNWKFLAIRINSESENLGRGIMLWFSDGSWQACIATRRAKHQHTSPKSILQEDDPKINNTVEWKHVRMILPQVHLRKPCYDFSFL